MISYELFKADFPSEVEVMNIFAREADQKSTVGMCQYMQINHVGWVRALYVSDGHRRKGIGANLLDQCRRMAKGNSMDSLSLVVRKDNQTAKRLYLKSGFRHVADAANGEIWSITP